VHGHGKRDLTQQGLEGLLWHAECGTKAGGFLHQREVFCGQGLQCELGLAALQDHLGLRGLQADRLVRRHGAQDVDQLARAHGGGEVACIAVHLGGGADLDFQIAGGHLHRTTGLADQHIGQHRQGVAAFHNAGYGLQNGQQFVLCGLQDDHLSTFGGFSGVGPGWATV